MYAGIYHDFRSSLLAIVNFTGAADRDLLKRAKIIAAKMDTSVNALFNAELRYLVETFEAAVQRGNQNFRVLLDFSLARIIDSEEDLFLLMAQAHLPMPRWPATTPQGMVADLNAIRS